MFFVTEDGRKRNFSCQCVCVFTYGVNFAFCNGFYSNSGTLFTFETGEVFCGVLHRTCFAWQRTI